MIKVKNKKVYNDLVSQSKDFRKGRIEDEKTLKDFMESNTLYSLSELLFLVIILLLGGYLTITYKIRWIVSFVVIAIVLAIYYLLRQSKK